MPVTGIERVEQRENQTGLTTPRSQVLHSVDFSHSDPSLVRKNKAKLKNKTIR